MIGKDKISGAPEGRHPNEVRVWTDDLNIHRASGCLFEKYAHGRIAPLPEGKKLTGARVS